VTKKTEIPDWETLLAHAALLQAKIPAAILVGGTAAAVHAGHRISFDHDHVVKDLAKNYDAAIRAQAMASSGSDESATCSRSRFS
jgi:hypothetical protein